MTIIFPLTMPATPGFRDSRFGLARTIAAFESPYTGAQQTLERASARWFAQYTLPPMRRAEAARWVAFLVGLRGRVGTFKGFDPDARTPQGVATGTPRVKGAGQTGGVLATDGWTPATAGILKAGDYIAIGAPSQRLHMVIDDADSDGAGNATVAIEPALRETPDDDAAITTNAPYGIFRLAHDEVGWDADHVGRFGLTFAVAEVL